MGLGFNTGLGFNMVLGFRVTRSAPDLHGAMAFLQVFICMGIKGVC